MGQGVQDIVNFLLKKHTIMAGWSQDSKTHMESVSAPYHILLLGTA